MFCQKPAKALGAAVGGYPEAGEWSNWRAVYIVSDRMSFVVLCKPKPEGGGGPVDRFFIFACVVYYRGRGPLGSPPLGLLGSP